jgi:LEA14-like dessication related protein
MEKKIRYIIFIAVLLIIAGICIGLFARAPVVTVSEASINNVNLSNLGLEITMSIESPYPITIPIKSIQYSISYQNEGKMDTLGEGEEKGIIMNPGKNEITFPVYISNPAIIGSLWEILKSGEIRLLISGTVTPDIFGMALNVPFSKEIITPVNTGSILSGLQSIAGAILGSASA